jgi:hypothetical protein
MVSVVYQKQDFYFTVFVSVQYKDFNEYSKISSATLGKSLSSNDNQKISKNMTNLIIPTNDEVSPGRGKFNKKLSLSLPNRPISTDNNVDTLILVVHGGNVMSITNSITNDFSNLKTTFDKVIQLYYGHAKGRIEYRLVTCEDICREALLELSSYVYYINTIPSEFSNGQGS